jgi:hypothetical protein
MYLGIIIVSMGGNKQVLEVDKGRSQGRPVRGVQQVVEAVDSILHACEEVFTLCRPADSGGFFKFQGDGCNALDSKVGSGPFELMGVSGKVVHIPIVQGMINTIEKIGCYALEFIEHGPEKIHISQGAIEGFVEIDDRYIFGHY